MNYSRIKTLAVVVAYEPSRVTPEQYSRLVAAVGDLVRVEGGAGIRRLVSSKLRPRAGVAQ